MWLQFSCVSVSIVCGELTRGLSSLDQVPIFTSLISLAIEMKIIDTEKYFNDIEAQEEVTNMMTGKKFKQSVNTPNFMSPACESYWSM